jgi:hypothetical protein
MAFMNPPSVLELVARFDQKLSATINWGKK